MRSERKNNQDYLLEHYRKEIQTWVDLPKTALKKYQNEKIPSVIREESLIYLDNLEYAFDYLLRHMPVLCSSEENPDAEDRIKGKSQYTS